MPMTLLRIFTPLLAPVTTMPAVVAAEHVGERVLVTPLLSLTTLPGR